MRMTSFVFKARSNGGGDTYLMNHTVDFYRQAMGKFYEVIIGKTHVQISIGTVPMAKLSVSHSM